MINILNSDKSVFTLVGGIFYSMYCINYRKLLSCIINPKLLQCELCNQT